MKTGKILDPIHGLIQITEIEEYLINQKIFGRLRKVKQNTLLNYIFPGANHTRFEHSIGVMHLSEMIFNNSNDNVDIILLKNEKYQHELDFPSINKLIKEEKHDIIVQELRLAALLHDVGHGPTSHKFDDFTITGNELLGILNSKTEIFGDYLDSFKDYIIREDCETKKIEHELVSCVFIISLIHTLKKNDNLTQKSIRVRDGIKVENIIKMIEPNFFPKHEIELENINFTDYFNSIISGFPFDADRMDYLYRDSFYSGVKYGFFDQSRILMSLLPVKFNNRITLGIKMSGLDSVIRFIQSRNHLYNQVYFHKTNASTNSMLDFVFRHLNNKSVLENVITFEEYESFYCKNGDDYFFNSTLKDMLTNNGCDVCGDGCIENDVLDELLDRNLWKRCFEERLNLKKGNFDDYKFNPSTLDKIKKELEIEKIYIQENYSSNLGLKGLKKSKAVIIDKGNKNPIHNDWSTITDEMNFLSQTNSFIRRIYVRRTFKNANEFKELSSKIINKFKEYKLID